MHADWQQYLRNAGAIIENDLASHFGDPRAELHAAQTETVLCDLSHFGLLYFSGEDARVFLHSQLSSNVQNLTSATAQYSSYCTPKGRVLATLLLWQTGDNFIAQLHGALRDSIQSRLAKFVLRSKVNISNAGITHISLGVSGKNAESLATKLFGPVPMEILGTAHHESATLIRLSEKRFQVTCAVRDAPVFWEKLRQDAVPAGSRCWDWLDIRSGIPVITPATQDQFVPQMLNMDAIGAISFSKGCYPGQEIVARTQHLGTLKRRMYLGNIRSEHPPKPGEDLFMGSQIQSGTIVNSAASPEGGYDALAVIQIAAAGTEPIHWKSPGGPVLNLLPLPYTA